MGAVVCVNIDGDGFMSNWEVISIYMVLNVQAHRKYIVHEQGTYLLHVLDDMMGNVLLVVCVLVLPFRL